ncbi:MAG: hypothetical protein CL681_05585 [Blastopirellula sp.]|nr:hypothetical protein [Blastopirellula sp.]
MKPSFPLVLCVLCVLFATFGARPVEADRKLEVEFFEKQIRPVLVKHCYACHSAKSKELGGQLRLDTAAGLSRGGESGPVIEVGTPEKSLLIRALRYQGTEMPPDAPLSEAVVNDFVRWVQRGAVDPRQQPVEATTPATPISVNATTHWSFLPRQTSSLPAVKDEHWPTAPIDHYVLAAIEQAGLQPGDDAPPATLVRRLYYDVLGLPPSLTDVSNFVAEYQRDGVEAVGHLVDRLLAQPQFGERWGRHWLDVARYGESNGDDGLGRNASFPHAWRYRDYVVAAWNADTPYDQFIREQVAGDLLPAATAAQRNQQLVATGFLAIGAKPAAAMNKNFAMDIVDDQIDVVSSAVLGLSVACARCHDHKHDPIPTRDYYALAGIFRSTETLYGRAAEEKLTAPPTELHSLVNRWPPAAKPTVVKNATPRFADGYPQAIDSLHPTFHASLQEKPAAWRSTGSAEFSAAEYARIENAQLVADGLQAQQDYSVAFWFKNEIANAQRPITAYLFSRATLGNERTGDHLGIGGKHDRMRTGKLFVYNGSEQVQSLAGETVIPQGSWNHVVLVRAGRQVSLYLNGVAEAEFAGEVAPTHTNEASFILGARTDKFAPLKGQLAEFVAFDRALRPEEIQLLHSASGQPRGVRTARRLGLAMGVRESAKPADIKVHINGETSQLGPQVPRGFLSVYQATPWPAAAGATIPSSESGRLQLAEWLTHPNHPQTARVVVNRVWQHLFGRAIVATPDDFGVYGARPSHPELLDHLAERLIQNGWSLKRLIREIVLTRTYQLDSRCSETLALADPDGVLLTHHLRRRLDAEALRDSLLQVSGALDLSPGQGSDVAAVDALINWPPGEASNLHRDSHHRSIYLCMLRHAPPPELAAFDLPDPTQVMGRRNDTTLPTQSLFLLNSPLVVRQAGLLAKDLLSWSAKTDQERVQRLYHRVLQRDPSQEETDRALRYVERASATATLPPSERNGQVWASLCQALLACNEFRYID